VRFACGVHKQNRVWAESAVSSVFEILSVVWLVAFAPLSWVRRCTPEGTKEILRSLITVVAIFFSSFAHADRCRDSVVQLGNASGGGSERPSVPREVLLNELALFYSEILQNKTLLPVFQLRLQEVASIEGQSAEDLYAEIEALADSPTIGKSITEKRSELRKQENAKMWVGLEPYLQGLLLKDREVIEKELIIPGRLNPVITGEVEFRFVGVHEVVLSEFSDRSKRRSFSTKIDTFGKGDDFAIGQVPVTQILYLLAALYNKAADPTPSAFTGGQSEVILHLGGTDYRIRPNHPVETVSWYDAMEHATRVSGLTNSNYSLPTEKEWEFAHRAGTVMNFPFGHDARLLPSYGWFEENSGGQTHAVGELRPNGYALHDTLGNVAEWTSSQIGTSRIFLGGAFNSDAEELSSSWRDWESSERRFRFDALGFRLKRSGPSEINPIYTFTFGKSKLPPNSESTDTGGKP
jgi:hypothetical protein